MGWICREFCQELWSCRPTWSHPWWDESPSWDVPGIPACSRLAQVGPGIWGILTSQELLMDPPQHMDKRWKIQSRVRPFPKPQPQLRDLRVIPMCFSIHSLPDQFLWIFPREQPHFLLSSDDPNPPLNPSKVWDISGMSKGTKLSFPRSCSHILNLDKI